MTDKYDIAMELLGTMSFTDQPSGEYISEVNGEPVTKERMIHVLDNIADYPDTEITICGVMGDDCDIYVQYDGKFAFTTPTPDDENCQVMKALYAIIDW